jgi:hypothetical protein
MLPLSGRRSFMISSRVVVFPHPDSPTSPSVSPSRMSRSTSATARTEPTVRFRTVPLRSGKVLPTPDSSSTLARCSRGTAASGAGAGAPTG